MAVATAAGTASETFNGDPVGAEAAEGQGQSASRDADLARPAASLISTIEIRDGSALAHYPRHAAAITSMRLWMDTSPEKAHMEPPGLVFWLHATSAACNRLAAVTSIHVELPGVLQAMEPTIMDSLLASIARACPSLRCLSMGNIVREEEGLVRAMFSAIGRHLPGIVELQLGLEFEYEDNFAIVGIDWAACLPRGLQKFTGYHVALHHELLQQLVLMPSLTDVEVFGLSLLGEELLEIQSDACTWRILRLKSGFPSCQELGRFTAAMPLLHLDCVDTSWYLGDAVEELAAVAKAAAWLSQIRNSPEELSVILRSGAGGAAATTAGLIMSSLAPLSGPLNSLHLVGWPVTEETLYELAEALPSVGKLTLWSCSLSGRAWSSMLTLTSVTDLTIYDGATIPLAQIIALVSAISPPMALTFEGGSVSIEDQAGWEAFEAEHRRINRQLQVTVHITQGQ